MGSMKFCVWFFKLKFCEFWEKISQMTLSESADCVCKRRKRKREFVHSSSIWLLFFACRFEPVSILLSACSSVTLFYIIFFLSTVVLDHIYSSTKGIFLLLLPLLKKPYIKWEKEQKIFWEDDNCHDLSKHMYPATRFLKLKYNFEYNNYSVFLKTNKNIFLKKYISSFWKQTPVSFVKKTYFQDCLQGNTWNTYT